MSATVATERPQSLVTFYCPDCLKRGYRNGIVRASKGSVVEAYCRRCKFRKVVII